MAGETQMSRIRIPSIEELPPESRPILENVEKRIGFLPNMHRVMALSPAALTGWSGLLTSLSKTLDLKTRDAIGLAVSEVSACHYCLSAHSYVSETFAKTPAEEIARNRRGESDDPKRQAAIQFAQKLVHARGRVSDHDFDTVRAAGFTDGQIVEIIALSAQFLLTNFVNNAVQTDIDFPVAEKTVAAAAE